MYYRVRVEYIARCLIDDQVRDGTKRKELTWTH